MITIGKPLSITLKILAGFFFVAALLVITAFELWSRANVVAFLMIPLYILCRKPNWKKNKEKAEAAKYNECV